VESRFRLIAATNRNLDAMVEAGTFRSDLLFRLRSLTIELPPLRDRRDDIQELILFHLARICGNYGIGVKGFSPEFLETLAAYGWPGNVRELVQAIERAVAVARHEPTLFPQHLPDPIRVHAARAALGKHSRNKTLGKKSAGAAGPLSSMKAVREAALAQAEREYLQQLLARTAGDFQEACRLSGLSRARLYALLSRHGIGKENGAGTP
jgi:two-component system, NtrC family, response regulator